MSAQGAIPFSVSSLIASAVFSRCDRPIPRNTCATFGELNVRVADDLDPIAPRVHEVEERAGQWLDARFRKRPPHRLLVVDEQLKEPGTR